MSLLLSRLILCLALALAIFTSFTHAVGASGTTRSSTTTTTTRTSTSSTTTSTSTPTITCGAPVASGSLFYSNATIPTTFPQQVGLLRAYGNGPLLVNYPGYNRFGYIQALPVSVLPCRSASLNTSANTIPGYRTFVKLVVANDTANCLGLNDDTSTSLTNLVVLPCETLDRPAGHYGQGTQFWVRERRPVPGRGLTWFYWPTGGVPQPQRHWKVFNNQYAEEELLAQPANCTGEYSCQDQKALSLIVK